MLADLCNYATEKKLEGVELNNEDFEGIRTSASLGNMLI
jgi:hypothetical protein